MRTMNTECCTILVGTSRDKKVKLTLSMMGELENIVNFTCTLSLGEVHRLTDLLNSEGRKCNEPVI